VRRHVVLLLVVGLVFGALAPAEAAKKKKKKPPAPVPVDVTYSVVWSDEACALSIGKDLADPAQACADPFAGGVFGPFLGTGPFVIPAIDGLPLTLDASKPIKGKFQMDSFVLADEAPVIMGAGQSEVHVVLTGKADGVDVTLGEATAEYLVTPDSTDYEFEFEIQPPAELTGKVLESLTISVEAVGDTVFHGVIPADGTSSFTIGALALPS
jgi:hypothetical protein